MIVMRSTITLNAFVVLAGLVLFGCGGGGGSHRSSNDGSAGGATGGSAGGDGAPGTVSAVDLDLSDVLGAVPPTPIGNVLGSASGVTVDGDTVNVTLGQANVGGLLSRTLKLALPSGSLNVGDVIPIVGAGAPGATAEYSQALTADADLLRLSNSAGGDVRVVARTGNDVTLAVENLRLNANAASGLVNVDGLTVDGTIRLTLP